MAGKSLTETTYCSVSEFEADFFPNLHESRLKARLKKKHVLFGAKFAIELLKAASQDLKKVPS